MPLVNHQRPSETRTRAGCLPRPPERVCSSPGGGVRVRHPVPTPTSRQLRGIGSSRSTVPVPGSTIRHDLFGGERRSTARCQRRPRPSAQRMTVVTRGRGAATQELRLKHVGVVKGGGNSSLRLPLSGRCTEALRPSAWSRGAQIRLRFLSVGLGVGDRPAPRHSHVAGPGGRATSTGHAGRRKDGRAHGSRAHRNAPGQAAAALFRGGRGQRY